MNNEPTWSLLRNTFDNVTKNNFKRAFLLSRDHRDKLKGLVITEPTLLNDYQLFNTDFEAFEVQYQAVNSNFGLYQGQTMQVENAFGDLVSTLARKWDVMVQVEYDQNSPEYKMILPDGRRLFQTGPYDIRLAAVGSLLSNVQNSNNPNFGALIANIQNWLNDTQAVRTTQQQTEAQDQSLRQDLESKRQKMMQTMHATFFALCYHFAKANDLVKMETLYELKYLRSNTAKGGVTPATQQNTLTLLPQEQKVLLKGSFTESSLFELKNTSSASLMFWLANSDSAPMPNDAFSLAANENGSTDGSELGNGSATYTHLLVKNVDDTETGKAEAVFTAS